MSDFEVLAKHPGCPPECRACHYKDLDYPAQLARKQTWAESRLGENLPAVIPAPLAERIGNRSKSWMRSSFVNGELSFGMIRAKRIGDAWGREFISWNECPQHHPAITEMLRHLRRILPDQYPEFAEKNLLGVWVGLPHLVFVATSPMPGGFRAVPWESILVSPFNRVWFHETSQVGKKIFGAKPIESVFGPPSQDLHPIRAFRQVAGTLLEAARNRAVTALLQGHPKMILDLYCGSGEIALRIPRAIGWLGIEHAKEAVLFARTLRSGSDAVHSVFEGAVEKRLRDPRVLSLIHTPYSLYINPPRPGLGADAKVGLAELFKTKRPGRIAYLSCSASSLDRDLEFFTQSGFEVESIQSYDFFPQTEHFETLVILRPVLPNS